MLFWIKDFAEHTLIHVGAVFDQQFHRIEIVVDDGDVQRRFT